MLDDLIILGGGATATAAFIELIRELRRQYPDGVTHQCSITILERSSFAGAGFPYDQQLHRPIMANNNLNKWMIICTDEPNDFIDWLDKNTGALKQDYPHLATIIDENCGKDQFAPRMIFCMYCHARLLDHAEIAKQLGIHVAIHTNTDIIDAVQDEAENWHLRAENHAIFSARNLLIATGHLPSDKFPALQTQPGFFNTPYTTLDAIQDAPVFILGSSLSAIDAAKLLAEKNITADIYMISPSGQLPRIKGPPVPGPYQMQYLTRENLAKKNIRLSEILELFTQEIRHATGSPRWTSKAIMRKARQKNSDPVRTLQREINWVEAGHIRGWQWMMGIIWYEPLPLIWQYMDDRDRQEFMQDYYPTFMRWAASSTLASAKEIAALFAKGRLHIISCSNAVTYNSSTDNFEITLNDQRKLTAKTGINATGTGKDIRKNPALHAMLQRGLVKLGRQGIGINLAHTLNTIAADNHVHDNTWAIGSITFGYNVDTNSIEMAAIDAKKIVQHIARKFLEDKLINNTRIELAATR